ncbi:DUF3231 family protein [Desulfosporosinus sp. SYSU MS00001]|uniref:DUF3231 family protein n=1 Tax=Desulfosporosinus sp. SYSU MS00001 TaxID=3416284 RepID=UPI003CF8BEB0
MLFYYAIILSYSILDYGTALTNSARKDVISTFNRLIQELLALAKDGTDLLIERKWLEQPPQSASRKKLMH